jgi:hypothetical protein
VATAGALVQAEAKRKLKRKVLLKFLAGGG